MRAKTPIQPLLLGLLVALASGVPAASARVLEITITQRQPLAGGTPFASSRRPEGIVYEMLAGRVRYGFDPANDANVRIVDLALAPRGEWGLVEATGDFVVLQPVDPADRRGTALVDVPNRGRRLALALFNRIERSLGGGAVLDPAATDWGDGLVMDQGLTLMWVGWQHDVPDFPGALGLDVPHAIGADGTAIEGSARSDWVVDEPTQRLSLAALGHTPQPAVRPDDPRHALTRRRGRETDREPVPRSAWRFGDDLTAIESTGAPFAPGWIYELVYLAQDPPLVGLGLGAFRDFVSFAKHDPRAPFPIERAVAHGLSQSGRFLRHLLYEGLDRDEAGRAVFEGAMIQIGGAGRGGFNHRFAHPGRVGNPYANFFYPGDDFPFTGRPSRDGAQEAGLFDRSRAQGTMPRVFQLNTGYEYWGRGASLVHMTPDAQRDVPPLPEERLYHLAGAPHYSLGFPPDPKSEVRPGLFVGSHVDTSVIQRALLLRLLAWVEDDVAPPPSTIPSIAAGSLVTPESLHYPIADLATPRSPHVAYHMDHGPDWPRGVVQEPAARGPAFPIRVPAIDALGNEATGIRPIELAVPIGTYLPWALRHGQAGGADEMTGYIGSFLPLATTAETRRPGDARPALSTLHPSREAYTARVAAAIDALVEAGFLLPRDRDHASRAAIERWEWITSGANVDWPHHGLTPHEERWSPLDRIDRDSVDRLGLAWSYDTGSHRGLEATPLVVDGVLYATSTWSVVFAVDAKTGRELWRHDPEVPRWKARHACCDVVNRGVAHHEGRIYAATLDGRLQALDAKTGALLWSVRTTELAQPYTITGAPRVVDDLIVIGNGGAEYGVRGYVTAYHAETGEQAWRFYTVPASKAGPHEHPALARAAATWPKDALWETGLGGTAWDSMAWDPELDLLYVGTGNASVYDREERSPGGGDNLYLASILALRPRTGELVWHYQTTPGEHWDYTSTQHMILADLDWQGERRKLLMQAPKNGFFYVLDRVTGELLSAEKFAHASWASHVDLETGRPVERTDAHWSERSRMVAPSPPGAHNWHPMSFHPETGLVYLPVSESIYAYHPDPEFAYRPGRWNTGESLRGLHEEMEDLSDARFMVCGRTRLVAWDPRRGEKAWEVRHDGGLPGGTLSTAGGLVFQGHDGGRFSAFDVRDGRNLWSIDVGVDVIAPPVTYAIDGEQYVAVLAGAGGSHGGHTTKFDHDNAGRLLAFKLDGQAPLPEVTRRPPGAPRVPRLDVPAQVVERGRDVYANYCFMCHGLGAVSSGLYPDLRHASSETHASWDAIVRGGQRTPGGMPSFSDQLSAEDAEAVRAYVLERAWHPPGLLERALGSLVDHACLPASWLTD